MIELKDPEVQSLFKKPYPPRIEDVILIAKKKNITSPVALWDFYDRVVQAYYDKKQY